MPEIQGHNIRPENAMVENGERFIFLGLPSLPLQL
jgi:hypothetical protein